MAVVLLAVAVVALWQWRSDRSGRDYRSVMEHYHQWQHQLYKIRDSQLDGCRLLLLGASHVQRMNPLLLGHGVVNFGVAGDTYAGLVSRFREYSLLEKCQYVFVQVGYNDLVMGGLPYFERGIEQFVSGIGMETQLVWSGLLPVDERTASVNPGLIRRANELIEHRCSQLPQCVYLPPPTVLELAEDGVHLTGEGYRQWADYLRPLIARLSN